MSRLSHVGCTLVSKITRPDVSNALWRSRLIDLLINADARIIIVSADAGYGKTTLAAQYAKASAEDVAWYRLEESDSSPNSFFHYLTSALDRALSEHGDQREEEAANTFRSLPEPDMGVLISLLEQKLKSPLLLILDDYHMVDQSTRIRGLIQMLLDHLPGRLRVMLLMRPLPSLRLSKLKASGQVLWLDATTLSFTDAEISAICSSAHTAPAPSAADIERAQALTGGWPAALVLLVSAWEKNPSLVKASPREAVNLREIYEYLAEEVFDGQQERVKQFLLDVCVLQDMSAAEAAQMSQVEASHRLLPLIEESNLFLHKVSESPPRYAFHPLFQAFLEKRLEREEGEIAARKRNELAASIYEANGDLDRAVTYIVSSRNRDLLDSFGRRHAYEIADAWRSDLARRLLDEVAEPIDTPWAICLEAYILRMNDNHLRARQMLEDLRNSLMDFDHVDCTAVLLLEQLSWARGEMGDVRGAAEACAEAVKASCSHPIPPFTRAALHMHLSLCKMRTGDIAGGLLSAREGLSVRPLSPFEKASTTIRYAVRLQLSGDCLDARKYADEAVELVRTDHLTVCASWILTSSAAIHMELGDYSRSLALLERSIDSSSSSPTAHADRMLVQEVMGDIYLGMGHLENALRTLERVLQEARDPMIETTLLVKKSACFRAKGDTLASLSTAVAAVKTVDDHDHLTVPPAHLAHAAALLKCDDMEGACRVLNSIRSTIMDSAPDSSKACWALHRAAVAFRQEGRDECDRYLAAALSLARQNRYVHLMIVEGRCAPELLIHALERGIESEFVSEILSRIGPWLLPHVERLLRSEDLRLALVAVRILKDTERSWARKPLLAAVRDTRPEVAKAAAEALAVLPVQQEDKLRIQAFGDFKVICGEREAMWRKRKAKHLMEYLFVNRRRRLPKDLVMDCFWPESAMQAAVNNFYVTFHALKRSLNPHLQRREQLPYFHVADGMIQLAGEMFSSDVDDFEQAWKEAQARREDGCEDEAIERLRLCRDLYVGDLMEDNLYEEWTLAERQDLRETYVEAMCLLARMLSDRDEHEDAACVLRRLVAKDKAREDLHLLLAREYVLMGNRALANTQFKLCQRAVREELGVEIEPETERQFREILDRTSKEKATTRQDS